jgi:hypothetical protein
VLLVLVLANLAYLGYERLVAESGPPAGAAETGAPVPRLALVSELKAPAGPSCLSVGPFAEHAAAEQAGVWLRNGHHPSRERSAEADGPATYWVALTTKTLQQAARISMRLKAAGVSDIDVAPPASNQTDATVSLGLYSDRDRAEHRVSDLRRFGVDPAIVEQQHKVTQWWLDVTLRPGDPPFNAAALALAVPSAAGVATMPCLGAAAKEAPAAAPARAPAPAPAETAPAAPSPKATPDPSSPGPAPAKLPNAPA